MHTRLISTPDKHLVPSPQPCAHTHILYHIHTTTHDIQCHEIHAPISDIQCIHPHLVYNTTQYIYIHEVQHNEYTCHDTTITQFTYILLHAWKTTCTTCTQYYMYTSTIGTTCTQHQLHDMCTASHVHNTTYTIFT